ncbi:dynamin family protein [Tumebacillus sp. ITR2]|uniref:Dynamin family protein n=1 Tax=Tumebacillus amylolyticus TaxID=2801339 RepID=A0ABS1J6N9_9BACL|nr:dynamin family protein [Tumebacillus amylolyticus]MBL0385936.1 dynamin family protein [Tumebacillus amylolyticus]
MTFIETLQVQVRHENLDVRLGTIADEMERAGNSVHGAKVRDLIKKLDAGEFSIAFCGHFSAGKSTMINTLLGADILPSSPIPTSANVVKIRGGESFARAYLTDGDYLEFDVAKDLEKIKNYAVDGTTVESIEIAHPTDLLAPNLSVMDTPGIDSTDDAHKVATESALHLADVVLYVMDYNHVQSELNFSFTKTLKDRGKPVYLIVNQIDKHMDFELSFDDYRDSVIEGFGNWGIEPDGLFFTTLHEPDHEENMFETLQAKISELFAERDTLLVKSVVSSAAYLIDEHRKIQAAIHAETRNTLQARLDAADNADELLAGAEIARQQLQQLQATPLDLQELLKKETNSLLDNAKITPFQTTELAGNYLKSRKPGFKAGFLASARKTQTEIENRLQALYEDFAEKVKANIDWHIRELLVKVPEKFGIRDETYAKSVYEQFDVKYGPDFLAGVVKEGGLSSDEYMYQYAKDIAAEVKQLYRREVQRFSDMVVGIAKDQAEEKGAMLRLQLQAAEDLTHAQQELAELQQVEQDYVARLLRVLTGQGE